MFDSGACDYLNATSAQQQLVQLQDEERKMRTAKPIFLVLCCLILTVRSHQRSREAQLLDMMMPRILAKDFPHVAMREGYRYSYKLPDGTAREEVGLILNPDTPDADLLVMAAFSRIDRDSITTKFTANRNVIRPRANVRNHNLSPRGLRSLTG